MMSSALEGADFEYSKTAEVREKFMDVDESSKKVEEKERLGNDLDNIDIQPGFHEDNRRNRGTVDISIRHHDPKEYQCIAFRSPPLL